MKLILKNCTKCNSEFNAYSIWGIKKFCSRKCSNSRIRTAEIKNKISQSMKTSPNALAAREIQRQNSVPLDKTCPVCKNIFPVRSSEKKKIYCGRECYLKDSEHKYRSQTSGGYRPGSGRSKSGYYKGIYCGSTYELCWVIYHLDHNIKFSRFEGSIENQNLKYYPDFLLDDGKTIVEIKGFEKQKSVDRKTKLAESFGYSVKVLRFDDLEFAFNYVKEKYTDNYHTLYDGYKPKYSHVCACCKNNFIRDKKLKTDVVFCSRQCAGRGHKGRKNKSL